MLSTIISENYSKTSSVSKYKLKLKVFLPAILGTVLEYYDYALYGFFAAVLAEQFFPTNDPTVALMKTFGVFVAGSLSKPLGACLFSIIGDHYGRSPALKYSLLGIAVPTLIIAFMPSYQVIGSVATAILLLCRILQGFFVSGESDGVRVYLYEHLGERYPCLINSLSGMACMLGIYLASLASTLHHSALFFEGAWRGFFLIGGSLGIIMTIFRKSLIETEGFLREKTEDPLTIKEIIGVLKKNKRTILATILICGAAGGGYHFYLVFLPTYLHSVLGLCSKSLATFYNSQAILVFSLCLPILGFLADRLGKIKIIQLSALFLFLMIWMNAWMMSNGNINPWVIFGTAAALAPFHALGFVFVYEKLAVLQRFRCASLGHAIGSMLFSGTTPLVSLWLWNISKMILLPFLYFALLLGIGYIGIRLCCSKKNAKPT